MSSLPTVAVAVLALGLTTGCSLFKTEYPPAYPAPRIPWDPMQPYLFTKAVTLKDACPQPIRRVSNPWGIPNAEEWKGQWKLQPVTQRVCKGKGTARRCRNEPSTAVDTANKQAVVRATPWNTKQGSSAHVRFPFTPQEGRIFEIVTSPHEFTYLVLLEGERQATQFLLNPDQWEVLYGKSGEEGARQEVLTVRPIHHEGKPLPPPARVMLVYQSGLKMPLLFRAQDRPGMVSVEWFIPQIEKPPPEVSLEQQPPAFNGEQVYAGYDVSLESKTKYPPPWFPEAVVDDGVNTLIKFRTAFEGVRLPIVNGVQQNGQPALVQARLYVRPGHGSWIWAQGLWPALRLKDAAGITVKAVRKVPHQQEIGYDDKKY